MKKMNRILRSHGVSPSWITYPGQVLCLVIVNFRDHGECLSSRWPVVRSRHNFSFMQIKRQSRPPTLQVIQ